jgi:tetratricopeptide (TPR) repeat protein
MKQLSYILSFLFVTMAMSVKAQTPAGTPDANFSIYKNKLKKSDESLTDEKKTISPKFWINRAELMMDIFELNRKFISAGLQEVHINLIYPNPIEKRDSVGADGSQFKILVFEKIIIYFKDGVVDHFTETVKLHDAPLAEALKCLEKAQEIDVEGKSTKDLKENFNRLKDNFKVLGVEKFIKPDYNQSYESFKVISTINEKPIMQGVVDTTILYYTGLAASKAGLREEAIKYYELAAASNYDLADLYVYLKEKYFEGMTSADSLKGLQVLETGFNKFQDSQSILIELINYYLLSNRGDQALEYLRLAQQDDPENVSFIFAEATLYDKMGNTEKARETYNKCIEQEPGYFNAYYNLGVMFYNKAVELYKAADLLKNPKEYNAAKEAADKVLAEAVPYMEKANEVADANTDWSDDEKRTNVKATLETLKTLYVRLQMTDKYKIINEELNQY